MLFQFGACEKYVKADINRVQQCILGHFSDRWKVFSRVELIALIFKQVNHSDLQYNKKNVNIISGRIG